MGKDPDFKPEDYVRAARQEIAAWERGKRGYLTRISDAVLNPAARLTAKMAPQSARKAAGKVIEKTLRSIAQAGQFSVDAEAINKRRTKRLGRRRAVGSQLKACDALAKGSWTSHCGYAAAEGAATGVMGFAGFVADIPLILSIAIREIRTIGLCYGYSTTELSETDYVLHILRIGSSGDAGVKLESLLVLKALEKAMVKFHNQKRLKPDTTTPSKNVQYLITIQEYAKSLAVELVQRRALQLVPLTGALTGASFNAAFANDIGRAAYMCYRRRFLLDAENNQEIANQGYI